MKTKAEIVTALQCCSGGEGAKCIGEECFAHEVDVDCVALVAAETLEYINSLSADYEDLKYRYELAVKERDANVRGFSEQIGLAVAEIEQLKQILEEYAMKYGTSAEKEEVYRKAGSQAVKAFVKKLKDEIEEDCAGLSFNTSVYYAVRLDWLDELAEEFIKGDSK